MSNTVIERVMEAIDKASTYGEGPRWRQELPLLARAAIEAIREPTDAMRDAYTEAADDIDGPAAMHLQTVAYQAMIDSLLKDSA